MGIGFETESGGLLKWMGMGGCRLLTSAGGILAHLARALHVIESGPIDREAEAEQSLVWSAIASKLNL